MQHYTRNTVEVSEWCRKCGKPTMHRVDGVKLGPCLVCMEKATADPSPPAAAQDDNAQQMEMFGEG